jgi:hypothetical protein
MQNLNTKQEASTIPKQSLKIGPFYGGARYTNMIWTSNLWRGSQQFQSNR